MVRMKTVAASGAEEAAAALNLTTGAAKRLQAIFDSTKGDPAIAASLAKTRDAAENLGRGFGDLPGPTRGAVNAANEPQRALNQWSQPSPEDATRIANDLQAKPLAAAKAAVEPAEKRAAGAEAAGRDVAAKPAEAANEAPAKPRPRTDAAKPAAEYAAAPAIRLGAPGASADLRSRFGIGIRTEVGEKPGAKNRGGPAATQPQREAMPAADPIEPAIKALLSEVAKMQDQHVKGLRQAVDVIASHSNTVDGLIQFMQTMAAHQEQLRADLNAHAQQLAATARSTQIP